MTATTTLPPELAAYLGALRAALADLPAAERDELLADVEASLFEAAADTGEPLAARFGTPEQFALELRSAAGLAAPVAATAAAPPDWRETARRTLEHARPVARELAPVWWALRGLLVAALLWLWFDHGDFNFGPPLLALLTAGVAASLALGMARRRRGSRLRAASAIVSLAAVVAVLPVSAQLDDERAARVHVLSGDVVGPAAAPGLTLDGVPVANIYPFTRDGRLLLDVLLYDEAGRPLSAPEPGPYASTRRLLVDRKAQPVLNAFPIRYFEPGTQRVARPYAAPRIEMPEIVTPPLRRRR